MNDNYMDEIVAISASGQEMNRDEYILFLKGLLAKVVEELENEQQAQQIKLDKKIERILDGNIDVLEQLNMALSFESDNDEVKSFKQGVSMAYSSLNDHLQMFGVKRMNSLHQDFNSELHDALLVEEVEDARKGKVIKVIKEGYMKEGKMLHPAIVVVGK